mmetsp:Transcript_319/g.962  ORF Transcript_319/g.962 Transcript_319/m.962 type:complete len:369 (-) Transcript_319:524-1630(-)
MSFLSTSLHTPLRSADINAAASAATWEALCTALSASPPIPIAAPPLSAASAAPCGAASSGLIARRMAICTASGNAIVSGAGNVCRSRNEAGTDGPSNHGSLAGGRWASTKPRRGKRPLAPAARASRAVGRAKAGGRSSTPMPPAPASSTSASSGPSSARSYWLMSSPTWPKPPVPQKPMVLPPSPSQSSSYPKGSVDRSALAGARARANPALPTAATAASANSGASRIASYPTPCKLFFGRKANADTARGANVKSRPASAAALAASLASSSSALEVTLAPNSPGSGCPSLEVAQGPGAHPYTFFARTGPSGVRRRGPTPKPSRQPIRRSIWSPTDSAWPERLRSSPSRSPIPAQPGAPCACSGSRAGK